MENGIIRTSAMREKKEESARVRYSAAYPTGRSIWKDENDELVKRELSPSFVIHNIT